MITRKIETLIYDYVIENSREITTKTLNSFGCNSHDINALIEKGFIKRIKRGIYEFCDLNALFNYGYSFTFKKYYDKLYQVFLKCYEFGMINETILKQLLIFYLKNKDYEKAFNYLEKIISCYENKKNFLDNNLMILLMSNLVEVPAEFQERLAKIKKDRSLILDNNSAKEPTDSYKYLYFIFRLSCFDGFYLRASEQIKNILGKFKSHSFSDYIFKLLLRIINEKNHSQKDSLLELFRNKEYQKMLDIVNSFEELTRYEKIVLTLVEDLLTIQRIGYHPKSNYKTSTSLYDAILDENYELALEYAEKFDDKNNNLIYLILKEINKYGQSDKKEVSIDDVANNIVKGDISKCESSIKNYLKQKNKTEYEYLLLTILKLNDAVKRMMLCTSALTAIDLGTYHLDFKAFIKLIYLAIADNNFKDARLYLDILYHYDFDKKYANLLDGLKNHLDLSEDVLKNSNNYTLKVNSESQIKEDEGNKYIKEKIDFISKTKGIIILEPMDSARRKKIHEYIKSVPNVSSFSIGRDDRRIVLKYSYLRDNEKDIKSMVREAKNYYHVHNYKKCLEVMLPAFYYLQKPYRDIFAIIGLSYVKLGEDIKALDYLIISDTMAKDYEDYSHDLLPLINKIKEKNKIEPELNDITIENFTGDLIDKYQIENLETIVFDVIQNGIDLAYITGIYGISDDQAGIIMLFIARYYYSNQFFKMGDNLIRRVEKMDNKSETLKKLLEEIKVNKFYYQNRSEQDPVNIILAKRKNNENH